MIDKKVYASKHCIARYREYCNDNESDYEIINILIKRFKSGYIIKDPPTWVQAKRPNQKYLVIGKNLVFPLVEEGDAYVAITCLHKRYSEKRKEVKLTKLD